MRLLKILVLILCLTVAKTGFSQANFWTPCNINPVNFTCKVAAAPNGNIFIGRGAEMFRSTNKGNFFTRPYEKHTYRNELLCVHTSNNNDIYAGTALTAIMKSSDGGMTWFQLNEDNGLRAGDSINSIFTTSNGNLFAKTDTNVMRSTNGGINWSVVSNGVNMSGTRMFKTDKHSNFIQTASGNLLVSFNKIFRSTNNGGEWILSNSGMNSTETVYSWLLGKKGNNIFACAKVTDLVQKVYRSQDEGITWQESGIGLPASFAIRDFLTLPNGNLFITLIDRADFKFRFYKSTNDGANWNVVATDLPETNYFISASVTPLGEIYMASNLSSTTDFGYQLYRSTNEGSSWAKTSKGIPYHEPISNIQSSSTGKIFARTDESPYFNILWTSTDRGLTWNESHPLDRINAISKDRQGNIFLLGANSAGSVFKTTDDGSTWTQYGLLGPQYINVLAFTSNGAAYIGASDGVYKSENSLTPWVKCIANLPFNENVVSIVTDDADNIYASYWNYGVYKSSNAGVNWAKINSLTNGMNSTSIYTLNTQIDGTIYAGTQDRAIFKSTNRGASWVRAFANLDSVLAVKDIIVNPMGHIYIAVTPNGNGKNYFGGVYKSTNNGNNWVQVNSDIPDAFVNKIALAPDGYLYTGSTYFGVARTTNTTEVRNISSVIPQKFFLYQNYPNPFNPSTNIKFDIKNSAQVSIKVFDLSGKEIEELFSKTMQAGTYSVDYNASHLSSGTYFYSLSSNGIIIASRKMVLIK